MQHDHLKTAVNRVRNAIFAVEDRRPRLRHDGAIERLDGGRSAGRGEIRAISCGMVRAVGRIVANFGP